MRKGWRRLEVLCWIAGIGLLAGYATARATWWLQQQADIEQFTTMSTSTNDMQALAGATSLAPAQNLPQPDRSSWSPERRRAYDEASRASLQPEGILRIPSIDLLVPIYDGTGATMLDRGAGRIENTAGLDEHGNIGLAGHRDGFFRGLKDLHIGDQFTIETLRGRRRYEIVDLTVTTPADVSVIAPTETAFVTLVTCFPFYFVGSAPDRYIVRAKRIAP
jgi:sortase A